MIKGLVFVLEADCTALRWHTAAWAPVTEEWFELARLFNDENEIDLTVKALQGIVRGSYR